MSYIIQATLSNARCREEGSIEILFPLNDLDYPDAIHALSELHAGDPVAQDCMVEGIDSFYQILKCLKGQVVNADELDYLAKRLDSFDSYEAAEFQAACSAFSCKDVQSLINMTFCCQETTVISDFSKLEEAGKQHYLTTQGGSAPKDELAAVDGKALAESLIQSGTGMLTPYGLFFRNGMRMENLYQGQGFPPYLWDERQAELEIKKPDGAVSHVLLPIERLALERFLRREDISTLTQCQLSLKLLSCESETFELSGGMAELQEWNRFCQRLSVFPPQAQQKFHAVLEVAGADDLSLMEILADSLDEFDLIPVVTDAESYGKYMIQKSGKYDFDESLDCYYNYEAFGEFLMAHEAGQITKHGYLKCEEGSAFLDFFSPEALKQSNKQPAVASQEMTM